MAVSMIVSQGSGSGNNEIDYNLLKCTFVQLLNLNTYSNDLPWRSWRRFCPSACSFITLVSAALCVHVDAAI